MRISVFASKEFAAAILALKAMDRELAKQTRAGLKTVSQSEWQEAVRGNVTTRFETRVLSDTARVAVTDQNITLKAAAMGRALSGGIKPTDAAHSAEFGADRAFARTVDGRGKTGTPYTRRTRAQFKPRNLKGRVVYPAAARVIPRMAALFVQTVVRTTHEAFEGK
jgi:hypothetical protein